MPRLEKSRIALNKQASIRYNPRQVCLESGLVTVTGYLCQNHQQDSRRCIHKDRMRECLVSVLRLKDTASKAGVDKSCDGRDACLLFAGAWSLVDIRAGVI